MTTKNVDISTLTQYLDEFTSFISYNTHILKDRNDIVANRLKVVSNSVKRIGETNFITVQDQKTGVLYTYGERRMRDGGIVLTPLVAGDGKPIVEPLNYIED